jgi:hypothetical protein
MKFSLRNANIAAAVMSTILVVGAILFRDSEGAIAVVVLAAVVIGACVNVFLDERDDPQRTRFRAKRRQP